MLAGVTVGGPVVSTLRRKDMGVGSNLAPCNFELWVPDPLSKFSVCNGHMMQDEITPPPTGGVRGVWVGGWVGQLGWVGGLASPEAAPK